MNVKGVPHRSPFRYPGGKTWLVPRTRDWLRSQPARPKLLVEAFAGGASVGLDALAEGLVERLLLVERDPAIAVVWRVLANGQGPALAAEIRGFDCRREPVMALLAAEPACDLDRALATIVKNRTFYGGITTRRSRPLVTGDRGLGIAARWNPAALSDRIAEIHELRDRIEVIEGDGLRAIDAHAGEVATVFFLDPPYSAGGKNAGRSLYGACELDHARLFELAGSLAGDFRMTYDDTPAVEVLASEQGFAIERIPMNTNRHSARVELFISPAKVTSLAA